VASPHCDVARMNGSRPIRNILVLRRKRLSRAGPLLFYFSLLGSLVGCRRFLCHNYHPSRTCWLRGVHVRF
jgi:hypothetical protein